MPDKTSMNIETKSGVIDLDSVKDNKTSPSQTINVMPDIKQKAHKMFDERFRCIQSDCDGNGNIPILVSRSRQISDTEFEQTQEWEAEQCQFHAQYIFPIKSFIDEIIDMAVAEEREKIKKEIQETLGYASLYKTLKNN